MVAPFHHAARANLLESSNDVEMRLGTPANKIGQIDSVRYFYRYKLFDFGIDFVKGHSQREYYYFPKGTKPPSTFIAGLLKLNCREDELWHPASLPSGTAKEGKAWVQNGRLAVFDFTNGQWTFFVATEIGMSTIMPPRKETAPSPATPKREFL